MKKQNGVPAQPVAAAPERPGQAFVRAHLANPVTQWLLDSLCGQAVVLDARGHLLASSEDALPALGLASPFPPERQFPSIDELDLDSLCFRASSVAFQLGKEPVQVCVFKDIRGQVRQEELTVSFFQELQDCLNTLAAETARLEAKPGKPGQPLSGLRDIATVLGEKLRTQQEVLLPRDRRLELGTPGGDSDLPVTGEGPMPLATRLALDDRSTVLVVDDSPVVLRVLEQVLTRENYRVLIANTGEAGLMMALDQVPDLILLDAVMPDLDGFQVCRRLKDEPSTRDIPVLFVTALRSVADEVFALKAGAIDFIPKPITPAILAARVRNHLELKHSKDRLRVLSLMDGLTGIPNRRQFDQSLAAEWQRALRNGKRMALIMGDVDFFKLYNDHFGHAEGDDCLRKVANVFKDSLRRPVDLAARFGGEEFVCLLPDTDGPGARMVAEGILEAMNALALPHPDSSAAAWVTVSLGVATAYPAAGGSPQALVEEADRNLYEAKRQGRNTVVLGS